MTTLKDNRCGNGCYAFAQPQYKSSFNTKEIIGYHCPDCGYSWDIRPAHNTEWKPDASYRAGMAYACGYVD